MLKNRKYIGEYKYDDVIVPGGIPAIITEKQFERVEERMRKNKKAPARFKANAEYLLSTRLFCGTCGTMMVGECGTSRNGSMYYYYKCGKSKRKKGCSRKALKKDWIETVVALYTINNVLTFDNIECIADSIMVIQAEEDPTIPTLRSQLQECKKGIDNLVNALQAGIISDSTKSRLDMLESQKTQLESAIELALIKRPLFTKDQIIAWISHFKHGDIYDKRIQKEVINAFVNSVFVYDDRIIINYNYKEGTETIAYEDLYPNFCSDKGIFRVPNPTYPKLVIYRQAFG